ncbi:MAG: hypothetical protein NVS2B14_08870 [Chamaesiphon sp.]
MTTNCRFRGAVRLYISLLIDLHGYPTVIDGIITSLDDDMRLMTDQSLKVESDKLMALLEKTREQSELIADNFDLEMMTDAQ